MGKGQGALTRNRAYDHRRPATMSKWRYSFDGVKERKEVKNGQRQDNEFGVPAPPHTLTNATLSAMINSHLSIGSVTARKAPAKKLAKKKTATAADDDDEEQTVHLFNIRADSKTPAALDPKWCLSVYVSLIGKVKVQLRQEQSFVEVEAIVSEGNIPNLDWSNFIGPVV
ncbi:hypothetical protein IFR05_014537, partial [Cadophora sp. M221]